MSDEGVPLRLYTVDVMLQGLELEEERPPLEAYEKKKERVKERLARDRFKTSVMNGEIEVSEILDTDADLIQIRKPFSQVRNKTITISGILRHFQRGFQKLSEWGLETSKEMHGAGRKDERNGGQGQRSFVEVHGGT